MSQKVDIQEIEISAINHGESGNGPVVVDNLLCDVIVGGEGAQLRITTQSGEVVAEINADIKEGQLAITIESELVSMEPSVCWIPFRETNSDQGLIVHEPNGHDVPVGYMLRDKGELLEPD